MPITVTCTGCTKVLKNIPDEHAGKKVICPKCGERIRVPMATPPEVEGPIFEGAKPISSDPPAQKRKPFPWLVASLIAAAVVTCAIGVSQMSSGKNAKKPAPSQELDRPDASPPHVLIDAPLRPTIEIRADAYERAKTLGVTPVLPAPELLAGDATEIELDKAIQCAYRQITTCEKENSGFEWGANSPLVQKDMIAFCHRCGKVPQVYFVFGTYKAGKALNFERHFLAIVTMKDPVKPGDSEKWALDELIVDGHIKLKTMEAAYYTDAIWGHSLQDFYRFNLPGNARP